MYLKRIALAGAVSLMGSAAFAACTYDNDVPLKSLSAGWLITPAARGPSR